MAAAHTEAIERLKQLQETADIKIIDLSNEIRPKPAKNGDKRNSAASEMSADDATPASLQADLIHYKELFSKLRFSYVEQVTKEKYLTAITVDPPQFVEPRENVELEAQLVEVKASLKAQKVEVAEMLAELERRGRELSKRYESIQLRTAQLETLPAEITNLESTIAELRETQAPHPTNPSLSLPLPETLSVLAAKEAELAALDKQLSSLQSTLPRKTRELERLEAELKPLEMQKSGTVAAAKEAQRRREAGEAGMGDDLEERGRWMTAVEQGLKGMLEVEG
ncbi:hypothetical protein GTA08_BOTSDO02074 [Neofusicoccum parvum]|uniref:Kinetochore protein Sos7 coiled-coil domain-containing protein n=2 Tax=Neofusicoccum parvum TaxID=310453 RepID=R1GDQ7_BOTPV|nr:hypothetical protein UCRNP2_9265 [Neofusicoccum parvum UCRNP2]GME27520.1 hypothetical protein GTA08_BOTSDO02074 [Neofusicoccum parvum]GME64301.1 hypothetical protein GTA08_BOTSDO02074 [Neofusicoccum parvum]